MDGRDARGRAGSRVAGGRVLSAGAETVELWRPVGPAELDLIRKSGMTVFPPRLPEQPIFYPVTTRAYAERIARLWNSRTDGGGHVLRFDVLKSALDRYPVQEAGGRANQEHWIPAEDLAAFNEAIVGQIELVESFDDDPGTPLAP